VAADVARVKPWTRVPIDVLHLYWTSTAPKILSEAARASMPSISVSQQVWEQLQRESERRGQSITTVLGELLGLPPTTAESRPQERTPIKTFRDAIVVALSQLGGRATKRQVLTALSSIVVLTPGDNEKDGRGHRRWEVQAGQAASQLRKNDRYRCNARIPNGVIEDHTRVFGVSRPATN